MTLFTFSGTVLMTHTFIYSSLADAYFKMWHSRFSGLHLSSPQVHLGGGIWVEEEKWHQLQRTQGDSKFTKNLAVMIWGTETLKNRSVTGVATKKKKDALPKPPLSPSKLKIVRGEIKSMFKPIDSGP